MGAAIGFAPFVVFAVMMNLSLSFALWLAFATAFGVGMYDFLHTRALRILDVGCTVLFGVLAIYTGFVQPSLAIEIVRLIVDGTLLAIALYSLLRREPFTLPYAREHAPPDVADTPQFRRMNYIVSLVWAIAFAVMAAADAAATFGPVIPLSLDIAIGLAALALAIIFTARYPGYARAHPQELAQR
ncbi:MAG TPA: hypothetical protein VHW02_08885 [Rhizomicrobium sp.]|jgi:hypothetical protein|nr:hypothetical protein [Rhizomicrobium sp.]